MNQKLRTRAAVLEAVVHLLDQGKIPTIAEAADEALVGRTTAYRYFPTQDHMLLEALLDRTADDLDAGLSGPDAPTDVNERVMLALHAVLDRVAEHEAGFRTILRLSLEKDLEVPEGGDPHVRLLGGRRDKFLAAALAPAEGTIPDEKLKRLLVALIIIAGVEPFVAMKYSCGIVDNDERIGIIEWIAESLVAATFAEIDSSS